MDIATETRTPLYGHTSRETAYVVDDYPYSWKLRCTIRYWLEFKKGHGFRLVSQTTNPRVTGEKWNASKPSTYVPIAGCMYLNSEGHVKWVGLGFHAGPRAVAAFVAAFPEAELAGVRQLVIDRINHSRKRASGWSGYVMKGVPVPMTEDEITEAKADVVVWTSIAVDVVGRHLVETHGLSDTCGMTIEDMVAAHKAAHAQEAAADGF